MAIDEDGLFKACFALAEDLMWEMETPPIEQLPEQLKELSEIWSHLFPNNLRFHTGCHFYPHNTVKKLEYFGILYQNSR